MKDFRFTGLEIPNLDCVCSNELDALSKLFASLSTYAKLKYQAMHYRATGHISRALALESECDAIYAALPDSVRW